MFPEFSLGSGSPQHEQTNQADSTSNRPGELPSTNVSMKSNNCGKMSSDWDMEPTASGAKSKLYYF